MPVWAIPNTHRESSCVCVAFRCLDESVLACPSPVQRERQHLKSHTVSLMQSPAHVFCTVRHSLRIPLGGSAGLGSASCARALHVQATASKSKQVLTC